MFHINISEFFWSVFFHTRTECGDLLRKFLYLDRVPENRDQQKLQIWALFRQSSQTEILL